MQSESVVRLTAALDVGYAEVGDPAGAPVLHLHGTPSSHWEVLSPSIHEAAQRAGVRLVAPDRPGMGRSTFRRFSITDYPRMVRDFAGALGITRFAVTAVSGGGKYACACARDLPDLVTRVALMSTTCSFDLPGARATRSKEDRQAYTLANRAPWLFRLYLAALGRRVARDPRAILSLFPELGPADRRALARMEADQLLRKGLAESLRQGARGPAHDYTLEARPWGVALEEIRVPVEVWHGEDDRVVSPEQSRILAAHLPGAAVRSVPEEGHLFFFDGLAGDVLASVVRR